MAGGICQRDSVSKTLCLCRIQHPLERRRLHEGNPSFEGLEVDIRNARSLQALKRRHIIGEVGRGSGGCPGLDLKKPSNWDKGLAVPEQSMVLRDTPEMLLPGSIGVDSLRGT